MRELLELIDEVLAERRWSARQARSRHRDPEPHHEHAPRARALDPSATVAVRRARSRVLCRSAARSGGPSSTWTALRWRSTPSPRASLTPIDACVHDRAQLLVAVYALLGESDAPASAARVRELIASRGASASPMRCASAPWAGPPRMAMAFTGKRHSLKDAFPDRGVFRARPPRHRVLFRFPLADRLARAPLGAVRARLLPARDDGADDMAEGFAEHRRMPPPSRWRATVSRLFLKRSAPRRSRRGVPRDPRAGPRHWRTAASGRSGRSARVLPHPALAATVEVLNVDQLRLYVPRRPSARGRGPTVGDGVRRSSSVVPSTYAEPAISYSPGAAGSCRGLPRGPRC